MKHVSNETAAPSWQQAQTDCLNGFGLLYTKVSGTTCDCDPLGFRNLYLCMVNTVPAPTMCFAVCCRAKDSNYAH